MAGRARIAETFLGAVAAAICLATAVLFSGQVELFPLPGLYLIEISLAGVLSLLAIARADGPTTLWGAVPWLAAGVLAAFVVLGMFSVGPFLAPAALALVLAGVVSDRRRGAAGVGHGVAFLIAAGTQATIMWLVFTVR